MVFHGISSTLPSQTTASLPRSHVLPAALARFDQRPVDLDDPRQVRGLKNPAAGTARWRPGEVRSSCPAGGLGGSGRFWEDSGRRIPLFEGSSHPHSETKAPETGLKSEAKVFPMS